jgi:DNA mismatch repair ATPase MutL
MMTYGTNDDTREPIVQNDNQFSCTNSQLSFDSEQSICFTENNINSSSVGNYENSNISRSFETNNDHQVALNSQPFFSDIDVNRHDIEYNSEDNIDAYAYDIISDDGFKINHISNESYYERGVKKVELEILPDDRPISIGADIINCVMYDVSTKKAQIEAMNGDFQSNFELPTTTSSTLYNNDVSFLDKLESKYLQNTHSTSMKRNATLTNSEPLNKALLSSANVLSQVNAKFIFAKAQDNSIVILDQHAADERITLENLYNKQCACQSLCSVCFKATLDNIHHFTPPVDFSLTLSEAHVLITKSDVLKHWGFSFTINESTNQNIATYNQKASSSITLYSSPIIHGEMLTSGDFIEFLHWYEQNIFLPLIMVKPPIVSRIIAFKACRNAIKFGDVLSIEECQNMMGRLNQCNFR